MIDFYYMLASPPCRSVIITADILDIKLRKIFINLHTKEHLNENFLKINPQHSLPTIVDNGFAVWESRAIMMYLVDKYATNDDLYPKDAQKRALVNHRLFFDMGTFYQSLANYYYPGLFYEGKRNPDDIKKIEFAFQLLNGFLENQTYVAGEKMTIADISLFTSAATYDAASFDLRKYPNVNTWYNHMKKAIPATEEHEIGNKEMKTYFDNFLTI